MHSRPIGWVRKMCELLWRSGCSSVGEGGAWGRAPQMLTPQWSPEMAMGERMHPEQGPTGAHNRGGSECWSLWSETRMGRPEAVNLWAEGGRARGIYCALWRKQVTQRSAAVLVSSPDSEAVQLADLQGFTNPKSSFLMIRLEIMIIGRF